MTKAEPAAFFNIAIVADFAASSTTDKIREELSGEISLQFIPGCSMTVFELLLLLPFDCGAIVGELCVKWLNGIRDFNGQPWDKHDGYALPVHSLDRLSSYCTTRRYIITDISFWQCRIREAVRIFSSIKVIIVTKLNVAAPGTYLMSSLKYLRQFWPTRSENFHKESTLCVYEYIPGILFSNCFWGKWWNPLLNSVNLLASEADGTYTHVLSLHTFPKFKFSYTLAPCVITIVPDKSNLPPICEDKDSLLIVGKPIYNLPKNVCKNFT